MSDSSSGGSGGGSSSSGNSSSDVKAVLGTDGKTDNYFGGEGRADGPGHGHIVVNDRGGVEYSRDAQSSRDTQSSGGGK
ncbi:hypothetical protein KJ836_01745 [Patescibacteria group bacterium]|nr:hypothetical protein [Patescibacteria group bacterium]